LNSVRVDEGSVDHRLDGEESFVHPELTVRPELTEVEDEQLS
jgi:hypothetical protein